ncbi:Hypothetical predicted protein [Octopus vulgaris]|uniref:Uncharacterized protein n=1 Tax=Octopus vulgaris TaxID=6645 RepID=A0AA36BQS0_OCTVU|nr:Hypothetical predicted protein [Octopus vulgaris]
MILNYKSELGDGDAIQFDNINLSMCTQLVGNWRLVHGRRRRKRRERGGAGGGEEEEGEKTGGGGRGEEEEEDEEEIGGKKKTNLNNVSNLLPKGLCGFHMSNRINRRFNND